MLICIGLNYKVADASIRESIAFNDNMLKLALESFKQTYEDAELVIVSTCNRTELYAVNIDPQALLSWLCQYHNIAVFSIKDLMMTYVEEQAVMHLFKVSAGLDSLVLGEVQILGQIKKAYQSASLIGTVSTILNKLFQYCFHVAKKIRTETDIGSATLSIANIAVSLAQRVFEHIETSRILLIGAGHTIELVSRYLYENDINDVTIANRTVVKAQKIADNFGFSVIDLEDIEKHLGHFDIIFSATSANHCIITKVMLEKGLEYRKKQPILLIDLAIPRDFDSAIEMLDHVYLYTVDDLVQIADKNKKIRLESVSVSENMIMQYLKLFMQWYQNRDELLFIHQYRENALSIRNKIVHNAKNKLLKQEDIDIEEVLDTLTYQLMNSLLHPTTVALKEILYLEDKTLFDALIVALKLNEE